MINPGLRKAVIALPVAWTGVWLTYYGKSEIRMASELTGSLYRHSSTIVHP